MLKMGWMNQVLKLVVHSYYMLKTAVTLKENLWPLNSTKVLKFNISANAGLKFI